MYRQRQSKYRLKSIVNFLEKYKIGRIEYPLYKYRSHKENRTKNLKLLKKFDNQLQKKR